jgi:hypothetical protein
MALACACALALPLGLGLAGAAEAATVTVTAPANVTIHMANAAATTLTLSSDASGTRIHEDGAVLTFGSDPLNNPGGCAPTGADIVCTNAGLLWTVDNGQTMPASPRDVLIAKSATHGDATGFFDETLRLSSATLMEAWLPDGPLANTPTFTGSETVTPAGQPADIVHVGSAGLSAGAVAASNLGGGDDVVIGSSGEVDALGGNGDDTLIGSSVNDTLNGGAGSDLIRGGLGQDTLNAGAGFGLADVLSYDDAARTAPLAMTFVPNAATTPNPDGDAVSTGFDGIEGTPLADNLAAASAATILRGAEGDDVLQGGPAVDTFDGGDGADDIRAGGDPANAETVDCGAGIDQFFTFDPSDTLIGCEGPQPVDPGVAPGGGPAQAGALPVALTGTGTGPGTTGTGASSLPAIGATLTAVFGVRGSSTTVTTLTAKKLPAGASVTITCKAPKGKQSACAFKAKTKAFAKATASSSFSTLFKKRKLPAKTVIVVRITAPRVSGKQFTFTARKASQPKRVAGCLAPGSTTATSC